MTEQGAMQMSDSDLPHPPVQRDIIANGRTWRVVRRFTDGTFLATYVPIGTTARFRDSDVGTEWQYAPIHMYLGEPER